MWRGQQLEAMVACKLVLIKPRDSSRCTGRLRDAQESIAGSLRPGRPSRALLKPCHVWLTWRHVQVRVCSSRGHRLWLAALRAVDAPRLVGPTSTTTGIQETSKDADTQSRVCSHSLAGSRANTVVIINYTSAHFSCASKASNDATIDQELIVKIVDRVVGKLAPH